MPHVVAKPQIIHHHLQSQTVAGEITINLNLTITINQDGTVQIATGAPATPVAIKDVPDSVYAIPEFDATDVLANFGEE